MVFICTVSERFEVALNCLVVGEITTFSSVNVPSVGLIKVFKVKATLSDLDASANLSLLLPLLQ